MRKKILVLILCLQILVFVSGCEEKTKKNDSKKLEVGDIVFSPSDPLVYENISFEITDTNNEDLTYNWSFGDDSENKKDDSVEHEYSTSGVYNVTVKVTDGVSSVTKNVEVSVDSFITSFDVNINDDDYSTNYGWHAKARNHGTSSFEYWIKITDLYTVVILIYNSSNDAFYNKTEGTDIWYKYENGSESQSGLYYNYSSFMKQYNSVISDFGDMLVGHKIGDNFTDYDPEDYSVTNMFVNDLNCGFSDDLFMPPSDEEIKKG